jgi:hypothetical protein
MRLRAAVGGLRGHAWGIGLLNPCLRAGRRLQDAAYTVFPVGLVGRPTVRTGPAGVAWIDGHAGMPLRVALSVMNWLICADGSVAPSWPYPACGLCVRSLIAQLRRGSVRRWQQSPRKCSVLAKACAPGAPATTTDDLYHVACGQPYRHYGSLPGIVRRNRHLHVWLLTPPPRLLPASSPSASAGSAGASDCVLPLEAPPPGPCRVTAANTGPR